MKLNINDNSFVSHFVVYCCLLTKSSNINSKSPWNRYNFNQNEDSSDDNSE